MISEADPNNTGELTFYQFKQIVIEKRENERGSSDNDLLDAYVAMGGDEDGGGCVDADKLIETIKKEFEMTIDIEALIQEVDEDGSGEIEFDEFKELLAGGNGDEDDDQDGGDDWAAEWQTFSPWWQSMYFLSTTRSMYDYLSYKDSSR